MHSSRIVRFASLGLVVCALLGIVSVAAAQDATEEPPVGEGPSALLSMEGACQQGIAATRLNEIGLRIEMTAAAPAAGTTEEPMMEATHDMSSMEATEDPMLGATVDAGMEGVFCLYAELFGENEVPGPGDEDGYGVTLVSIDPATAAICYEVAVANITLPAAAMHIHQGDAGVAGDVVVPFATVPDASGMASECFYLFDRMELFNEIVTEPARFYVNVHTEDFPDGAVRGQLADWKTVQLEGPFDLTGDTADMTPETTTEGGSG